MGGNSCVIHPEKLIGRLDPVDYFPFGDANSSEARLLNGTSFVSCFMRALKQSKASKKEKSHVLLPCNLLNCCWSARFFVELICLLIQS